MALIAITSELPESTIARERDRGAGSMPYSDLLWCFAVRIEIRRGDGQLRIDEAPLFGLMFALLDGIETLRRGGETARAQVDDPEGMFSLHLIRSGDVVAVTQPAPTVWIEAEIGEFEQAVISWIAQACADVEKALPELLGNPGYGRLKQELESAIHRR